MKVTGKHADDIIRSFIESYRPADDLLLTAKTLLPCSVAEDQSARRFRQILACGKITTEQRANAKSAKEACADTGSVNHFHTRRRAYNEPTLIIDVHRVEDSVELFPVEIVRV